MGCSYMVIYVCLGFTWTVSNFSLVSQIEEESRRITLKPLQTTFLLQYFGYFWVLVSVHDHVISCVYRTTTLSPEEKLLSEGCFSILGKKDEMLIKDYKVKKIYLCY